MYVKKYYYEVGEEFCLQIKIVLFAMSHILLMSILQYLIFVSLIAFKETIRA